MSTNETERLAMPLLQPAQAQKHVTVNEALMRLDGMVNLVVQSASTAEPPATVVDSECWAVPQSARGQWAGRGGAIAIGSNHGWVLVQPKPGMRAFVADQGAQAVFDGQRWIVGAVTMGVLGSGMIARMQEAEVTIAQGANLETSLIVPAGAMVIGAVARVAEQITGTLGSWRLGTPGADDRFGRGLGTAAGSWARGTLSVPMTYYDEMPLVITAEGGEFTAGKIRIGLHWLELKLPN